MVCSFAVNLLFFHVMSLIFCKRTDLLCRKLNMEEMIMLGTIFLDVVIFIGGACGVLSCLYMVLSLIAVLFYKFFRRIRFGISLFD